MYVSTYVTHVCVRMYVRLCACTVVFIYMWMWSITGTFYHVCMHVCMYVSECTYVISVCEMCTSCLYTSGEKKARTLTERNGTFNSPHSGLIFCVWIDLHVGAKHWRRRIRSSVQRVRVLWCYIIYIYIFFSHYFFFSSPPLSLP